MDYTLLVLIIIILFLMKEITRISNNKKDNRPNVQIVGGYLFR